MSQENNEGAINTERLSFPLRMLIQVIIYAVLGACFIVRIEGKLNNLSEKVQEQNERIKDHNAKSDAIHTAQSSDLSEHNVRISVLERDREYDLGKRRSPRHE